MKFKTQFNQGERKRTTEKNSGLSQTIPDQSMSIKEILIRNQRGLPLSGIEAVFHDEKFLDDESGRNPANMDISEIVDELQAIEERIRKRNEDWLQAEAQRKKEAAEKAEELKKQKWIEEWKATFQNPTQQPSAGAGS